MTSPRRALPLVFALSMLFAQACTHTPKKEGENPVTPAAGDAPVLVKILALNDLHGHIEGPSGEVLVEGKRVEAGGVDALAFYLARARASHPNTVFVAAGDLVGASPLISALFHDEPTIEAMSALGMDLLAVGNHEFDEGVDELKRLSAGGCHPEDGCTGKERYDGASFPFLAANVVVEETGETLFEPYLIKEFEGVSIGFIGLTLEGTPDVVSPQGVRGVKFLDEAETINAYASELQSKGVEAIVVVMHEGAAHEDPDAYDDIDDCPGLVGPLVEINARLSPAVDVIIAGHTHQAFKCTMDGRLLTSAKSYGRILTEIDLTLDPKTGDVIESSAHNVAIRREVDLDKGMAEHIARYKGLVGPMATAEVGTLAEDLVRDTDEAGFSPLAGIIADAQLQATSYGEEAGTHLALMNLGGVRDHLRMAPSGDEGIGIITYEELFDVQPFGNTLVVLKLTGAQLHDLLESQFANERGARLLQPSAGFTYVWSEKEGEEGHVDPKKMKLHGEPILADRTYTLTVNSFLAGGGDGFALLADLEQVAGGPVDIDALRAFLATHPALRAPSSRIERD